MTYRPALRRDIFLKPKPGEPESTLLYDPRSQAMFELPTAILEVAEMMNGRRTLEEVAEEAAARLDDDEVTADWVRALTQQLTALGLLKGSEETLEAPEPEEAAPRPPGLFEYVSAPPSPEAVQVRDGLRYSCMQCGMCCSGRFHIPLSTSDEERLRGLDLEGELGLSFEDVVGDFTLVTGGLPQRLLGQREDGRCVFLGEDKLCEIHRRFGYAQKPHTCRTFPFQPILTPTGPLLRFRPECSRQHRSGTSGAFVQPQARAIWADFVADSDIIAAVPVRFPLTAGEQVRYDDYLDLESDWSERLEAGQRSRALAAMRIDLGFGDVEARLPELADILRAHPPSFEDVPLPDALLEAALREPRDAAPLPDAVEDALLRYARELLFGKYLFYARTLAAGGALFALVFTLLERTLRAAHADGADLSDPRLVNEIIIAWHLALYHRDDLRGALLEQSWPGEL